MTPPPHVGAWNIANGLTAVRLALVPVFGWLLLHDDGVWWQLGALTAFVVAGVTDRLDGEIARRRQLVTNIGKIADPIADKALVGTALVGLSVLGELSWWVTAVVLLREIGITLLRFVVIRHGVMPAGRGGKAKTVLQSVAIGLYVAPLPQSWQPVAEVVMGAAVLLTVLTGLDYVVQAYRMRAGSDRTRRKQQAKLERSATPS